MIVEAVVVVHVDVVRDVGRGHDGHVDMNINPKKYSKKNELHKCPAMSEH